MIQIIPVINSKGGVGKTTTAVTVAAGLARLGRRVLLVDLDSQGAASLSLGVQDTDRCIDAALMGEIPFGLTVRRTHVPNLSLSPSSLGLSTVDARLANAPDRVGRLQQLLIPVKRAYDTIIIDCDASASLLNVNALVAADALIVPATADHLSLQALNVLDEVRLAVQVALGRGVPTLGVLLNNVKEDPDSFADAYADLRSRYGGKVFETVIHRDDALMEAPAFGVDVFEYAPESRGASDFNALIAEIEERRRRYDSVMPHQNVGLTARRVAAVEQAVDLTAGYCLAA